MKLLLPVCTLCGDPIKPNEPRYHKNGEPHVHAHHYRGMGDRYVNPWALLAAEPPDPLASTSGATSPQAVITNERRTPPAPDADDQPGDLAGGARLARLDQVLRAAGLDPTGRMARAARNAVKVECPLCGVPEGAPCLGKGLAHRSRRKLAREVEKEARSARRRRGYGLILASWLLALTLGCSAAPPPVTPRASLWCGEQPAEGEEGVGCDGGMAAPLYSWELAPGRYLSPVAMVGAQTAGAGLGYSLAEGDRFAWGVGGGYVVPWSLEGLDTGGGTWVLGVTVGLTEREGSP